MGRSRSLKKQTFKKSHFELKVDVLIPAFGIVFCDNVFSKWMHSSFVDDSNTWNVVFKVFKVNPPKYFNHVIDFFPNTL